MVDNPWDLVIRNKGVVINKGITILRHLHLRNESIQVIIPPEILYPPDVLREEYGTRGGRRESATPVGCAPAQAQVIGSALSYDSNMEPTYTIEYINGHSARRVAETG
ncbi:hypothetical protein CIRG_04594 [Coccidioides immitis RMSCC 2394]|uniref:Uncharacterized protein n=1 Tax=Coccidioides immitis RMSCC 2394 TaxID=404692 RepID=A0A0J6YDD3_COCIT|nr:hypothetical protein CIRG_04594 [Coccidioides immitis RMSCC 2394]